MNARGPDPERWSDRQERDATLEGALGATFRHVREATLLSDEAFAGAARRRREPRRHVSVALFAWRAAIAAALIASTAGAVGAAAYYWRRHAEATHPVETAPPAAAPAKPRLRARVEVVPQPPTLDEAPIAPSAPANVPSAAPWPRTGPRDAPRLAPPAEESEVLGTAFRELRTSGDPAAAIRALDEYDRRFPTGVLRAEARIARVEAFMAQDRRRDALPLLSELADDDGALTRGVRITRGELYAEAGRCPEAIHDFDRVLAVAADDPPGGRALYGRASCRLRGRDVAGARTDLETYLALHAEGAFAIAARRALESLP